MKHYSTAKSQPSIYEPANRPNHVINFMVTIVVLVIILVIGANLAGIPIALPF